MRAPPGRRRAGGALALLDHALELTRRSPRAELLAALAPGLAMSTLALALYYVERVEGVRSLRPVFACAFALSFALRSAVLARFAGARVRELLSPYAVSAPQGPWTTSVRAGFWIAFDLWMWLWLLVLAIHVEPWLIPLLLPLFSLRAVLAPGWLACSDTASGSGLMALRRAADLADGQRLQGIVCELLLSLGSLGIAFNVGAIVALALSVAQELLGLDLAFVRAFLSPENHFMLLAIGSLSLAVLEPVRAAVSALLFAEATLAREGAAVRSAVERAVTSQGRARVLAAGLMLVAAVQGLGPSPARAEPPPFEADGGATRDAGADAEAELAAARARPCEGACAAARAGDAEVEGRAQAILREPSFAEFPDEEWGVDALGDGSLESWLERFIRWLLELDDDEHDSRADAEWSFPTPGPKFFVTLAAVLALVVLARVLYRRLGHAPSEAAPAPDTPDPFARHAEAHLDDALALFKNDLGAALRSLYLATLVGLERRSLLRLSAERTNGQYLRDLPEGEERTLFAGLTRVFDAVHYGARPATMEDFVACREAAVRLVRGKGAP